MSALLEEGVESPFFIEGEEIIAATDVPIINEDLRYGMPSGALAHLIFEGVIPGDIVLYKRDPFDIQKFLGPPAVGAVVFGVNFNLFHD